MGRYTFLVGKRVEAHYRAGDVYLAVTGVLVSDSGKGVCIEERFRHGGRDKVVRAEVPYEFILRLTEVKES